MATEGLVIDGDVTILRNWCFERTTWLSLRFDVVAETMHQTADELRTYAPELVTDRSADD